jgi:hypothetical protein
MFSCHLLNNYENLNAGDRTFLLFSIDFFELIVEIYFYL